MHQLHDIRSNNVVKMSFSFDANKFQKSIEKEFKKIVQKEQVATSVNMQPDMGGIKMLDKMCEEALQVILQKYDKNPAHEVNGTYDEFPQYMKAAFKDTFEKLKLSGVIASYLMVMGGWSVNLTPDGISYFESKKLFMEKEKTMFKKLTRKSKKLLDEILQTENPTQILCEKFEKCSEREDDELRSLLSELVEDGYISIMWADNVPQNVSIKNSARTYDERLNDYENQLRIQGGITYNIGNIHNQSGVLAIGDISNTTISIDNSIQQIAREIETRGGDEKDSLSALLSETKELIENINATRQIPKNSGFFKRLSSHLEKHGWFYGEIVGLLGVAVLQLMQI